MTLGAWLEDGAWCAACLIGSTLVVAGCGGVDWAHASESSAATTSVGSGGTSSAGSGSTTEGSGAATGGAGGSSSWPVELATRQDHPARLALDESHVYFTDLYGASVNRVAKAGGPTTMITKAIVPTALAVNGGAVYYVDTTPDLNQAVLQVVAKEGGAPAPMITEPGGSNGIADVAATDGFLYYFVAAAGLAAQPLQTQPDLGVIEPASFKAGITLASDSVYWFTVTPVGCGKNCQTFDYAIRSVGAGLAGAANLLATGTGNVTGIAADAKHVYWIADSTLFAGDVAGGLEQTLYTADGALGGVAADGNDVFVTDTASGTVIRISPTSGGAETIAVMQEGPQAIAVDDDAVYWANFYGGSVMKLQKSW